MVEIHSPKEYSGGASVVALGLFDGVHIAHQALIRRATAIARAERLSCVVCTFDRRPADVLHPDHPTQTLLSLAERLDRFRLLGADYALVLPFTLETAQTPAEDFLRTLVSGLNAKVIVAGYNYTFGKNAIGNAELLEKFAPSLGSRVEIIEPVSVGGERVSSTRIRQLLQNGEIERARALMQLDV